MELRLIVAVAENGVIGADGALPWHLSADLSRFRRLTMGHTLIMGRKTFESIGRPLPGRVSVVLSRDPAFGAPEGVLVAESLDRACAMVETDVAWVIGGASVFREALARAAELHLTRVHAAVEGDVFFPQWRESDWEVRAGERTERDDRNEHATTYLHLRRRGEPPSGESG